MIVTVTLNAAVDITYTVEGYSLDRVHRPSDEKSVPGGKGINVARVLHTLGRDALATGFAGGYNGGLIKYGLDEEGIDHDFVYVDGESRLCIAVVDPVNKTQTEVNENGPMVTPEQVELMHQKLESLIAGASHLVLSGSAPPGVPLDFYIRPIKAAKAAGVTVLLDSSGDHLRMGLTALPDIIKPNIDELSAYVGTELLTVEDAAQAAKELAKTGIHIVIVSMGRAGAIATDGEEIWEAVPPSIKFVSAVGSGDSLVAAFIDSLSRGESLRDALVAGVAAGAANAENYGAGFCTLEQIEAVKLGVVVSELK